MNNILEENFKKEMKKALQELTLTADIGDYNVLLGALTASLSHILTDSDLVGHCWMDVLKEKLVAAVKESVFTANKYKAEKNFGFEYQEYNNKDKN